QNGLLLLWCAVRGKWRAVVGGLAVVGPLGLLGAAMYGWNAHVDYLAMLSYIAPRGEGYWPNQSFNGVLNRAFHNGNNGAWAYRQFAPWHPVVAVGTYVTSLVLIAGALTLRRGR